ncbi:hypothetical protein H2203_001666 [Taxawa tesnikishii (nom. ined.)]|nr:hypothetical protein H2203_001666 [Dothideales sp. JES 119]
MEKWMRGGTIGKKGTWDFRKLDEIREHGNAEEKKKVDEVRDTMQEWVDEDNAPGQPANVQELTDGPSPASANDMHNMEDGVLHEPLETEHQEDDPVDSYVSEGAQDHLEDDEPLSQVTAVGTNHSDEEDEGSLSVDPQLAEESSLWDAYQSTATPQPFKRKDLLQPTVEDYHSEITPSRPAIPRQHTPKGVMSPAEHPRSISRGRRFSPGRPSSPTLSPERTPMAPAAERSASANREETIVALRRELEDVRNDQRDTIRANDQFLAQVRNEQTMRAQAEAELGRAKNRIQILTTVADGDRTRHQQETAGLRRQLQQSQESEKEARLSAETLQQELDHLRETEDADSHDLQLQLKEARDIERSLKGEMHTLQAKTDDQAATIVELTAEKDGLVENLTTAQKAEEDAKDLEWNLREDVREMEEKQEEQAATISQLRENISELERKYGEQDQILVRLQDEKDQLTKDLAVAWKSYEEAKQASEAAHMHMGELVEARAALQSTRRIMDQEKIWLTNAREQEWQKQRSNLHSQLEAMRKEVLEVQQNNTETLNARYMERMTKEKAESELRSLRFQFESFQTDAKSQLDGLRRAKEHSEQLLEALRVQVSTLRQHLDDERARHDEELDRMRQRAVSPIPTIHQQDLEEHKRSAERADAEANAHALENDRLRAALIALQTRHENLQTEYEALNEQRHHNDELKTRVQTLESELSVAKEELAAARAEHVEINAALDARIGSAIEAKQKSWRRKVEELERERELMGKALMDAWGREECGKPERRKGEERQRFEYRYAKA